MPHTKGLQKVHAACDYCTKGVSLPGIGAYVWNTECLRGDVGALENATAFPQAIGLAASFRYVIIRFVFFFPPKTSFRVLGSQESREKNNKKASYLKSIMQFIYK